MSYCRWSCENFRSDVYVYASMGGGIVCHVAGYKHVGEAPPLPPLLSSNPEEFAAAHRAQMTWIQTAQHVPIGLPHDGETFTEPDELAMVTRLLALRALGYHVPEFALESLRSDAGCGAETAEGDL